MNRVNRVWRDMRDTMNRVNRGWRDTRDTLKNSLSVWGPINHKVHIPPPLGGRIKHTLAGVLNEKPLSLKRKLFQ